MKKLHKLILFSYFGPLIFTFFIALFILLMQFLWKYVDDLVGKGLQWYIIAQLMFYASASFIPMALPLAILLSSIMTLGNLGEHSELTACKASGISLQRVMRPLVVVSILLSVFAFYFSNNILPLANLKFGALLYDVREQRPAFSLREGIFYNGLEGYIIKVGKIGKDGQALTNIIIYDHTQNMGNTKVITAKTGAMSMAPDSVMVLTMYDGNTYEEVLDKKDGSKKPFQRMNFQTLVKRFDMSGYKFNRSDEDLFKDNYQMLNLNQLLAVQDTHLLEVKSAQDRFAKSFLVTLAMASDSLSSASHKTIEPLGELTDTLKGISILENIPIADRGPILENAVSSARSAKMDASNHADDADYRKKSLVRYQIELHRKFTLPCACLILFFIGAPLGAIIRKGGLGMPVFMSTIFFVFYYIVSISGEKFAKETVISPEVGMWLASVVLLPIGLFLTIKATSDSALFDIGAYTRFFTRPFRKK